MNHSCMPLRTKPTRVTRTTATIIDHIFTNSYDNQNIKCGIIQTAI